MGNLSDAAAKGAKLMDKMTGPPDLPQIGRIKITPRDPRPVFDALLAPLKDAIDRLDAKLPKPSHWTHEAKVTIRLNVSPAHEGEYGVDADGRRGIAVVDYDVGWDVETLDAWAKAIVEAALETTDIPKILGEHGALEIES